MTSLGNPLGAINPKSFAIQHLMFGKNQFRDNYKNGPENHESVRLAGNELQK